MREDFYDTRSPTPSRELQQHKWSCSGSSLSGRVIASVAAGQQGGCQTSGIHLMLRYSRQTIDLAKTLRTLTSTEFCHEADTDNRQCQCSLLARPHDPAVVPQGSSASKKTCDLARGGTFGLRKEKLGYLRPGAVHRDAGELAKADNRASPSASQERSMSLEPHRHNSKLSNFMQSARYVSGPVTELQ